MEFVHYYANLEDLWLGSFSKSSLLPTVCFQQSSTILQGWYYLLIFIFSALKNWDEIKVGVEVVPWKKSELRVFQSTPQVLKICSFQTHHQLTFTTLLTNTSLYSGDNPIKARRDYCNSSVLLIKSRYKGKATVWS